MLLYIPSSVTINLVLTHLKEGTEKALVSDPPQSTTFFEHKFFFGSKTFGHKISLPKIFLDPQFFVEQRYF